MKDLYRAVFKGQEVSDPKNAAGTAADHRFSAGGQDLFDFSGTDAPGHIQLIKAVQASPSAAIPGDLHLQDFKAGNMLKYGNFSIVPGKIQFF